MSTGAGVVQLGTHTELLAIVRKGIGTLLFVLASQRNGVPASIMNTFLAADIIRLRSLSTQPGTDQLALD
jgi:hypothetical protein